MSFSVVKNGTDFPGFDIKCDAKSSLNSQVSCAADPSCLAYNEKNGNQCNKYGVERTENNDGMSLYIKDTSNCLKIDNAKGDYVPAYCLSSMLPEDSERQLKLITTMESKNPKVLVIGKSEDRVMFIQYTNNATYNKSQIPYSNTDLGKKMTIFMYFIMTVKTTDKYRLEAMNNSGDCEFFVNGIPMNKSAASGAGFVGWWTPYVTLTSGDYFICVSFDISKSTASEEMFSPYIRKFGDSQTLTASAITLYTDKPINFVSNLNSEKLSADANFCNADNYTTSEYCKQLIKEGLTLNNSIKAKCFVNNSYVGDEKCSSLINLSILKKPDVNSELMEFVNSEVTKWFKNKISSLGSASVSDVSKLNSLFVNLRDLHGNFEKLFDESTQTAIVSFCEPKAGDVPMYMNNDTICGKIYRMDNVQNYPKIRESQDRIMTNYCKKDDGTGKKRYETDVKWCSPVLSGYDLLNTEIINRCSPNGKWNIDDKYCNELVDRNINGGVEVNSNLLKSLVKYKNDYAINELSSIENSTGKLKTEDYINNQLYDYVKNNSGSEVGLENSIINDKFLDYCLTKDPYLTNSSCKGVYSRWDNNSNIVRSRASMRTKNCLSDSNLMTELETKEAIEQNKNNCKTLATSTDLNSVGTFGSKVAGYCAQGDNIISEDCKKYYNDISKNLASSLISNTKINTKSSFDNAEESVSLYSTLTFKLIIIILFISFFVFVIYQLKPLCKNNNLTNFMIRKTK